MPKNKKNEQDKIIELVDELLGLENRCELDRVKIYVEIETHVMGGVYGLNDSEKTIINNFSESD